MRYAFTLIELLVVLSIISLLASIVFASVNTTRDQAYIAAGLTFEDNVHKKLYNCLIAQYDFEEPTVLGLDSSGYDHHGTNNGATSVEGVNGGFGVNFAGSQTINVPQNQAFETTTSFAVSFWYQTNNVSRWYPLSISDPSVAEGYRIWHQPSTGNYSAAMRKPSWTNTPDFNDNIEVGRWTHVMYQFNNANVQVYENGVLVNTHPIVGEIDFGNGALVRIGQGHTHTMQGQLDNIRFYNCGL